MLPTRRAAAAPSQMPTMDATVSAGTINSSVARACWRISGKTGR